MMRRKAFVPLLAPLLILGLAACDLLGGSGPDIGTKPSVSTMFPADGEQDFPPNALLSATLELPNGAIDQSTVNSDTVTLTQNGADVAAQVMVSGNTITLDPTEPLSALTTYTFSVTTSVKDQSGQPLAAARSSTFRVAAEGTESGRPSVSSVSPEDGAQGVVTDISVSATLTLPNGPIDADTVGNNTVTLTQEGSDSVLPTSVDVAGSTITLTPNSPLAFSTRYTFSITTVVEDQSGASLAEAFSSTFTTAAEGVTGSAGLEPSAERLIFEAQNNQTSESQTLTLTNAGDETFSLNSLAPAGDQFTLTEAPSLPVEIAPGGSVEVAVAFKPTQLGPQITTLNINGSATPEVGLRGLSVVGDGGDNEPSLQWIFDTFDLSLSTGDDNPADTPIVDAPSDDEARSELLNNPLGDEVIVQRFQKAGSGEVTIEVLAAYGVDNTPVTEFGWYEAGNAEARNELFEVTSGADNAQTLNPDLDGELSFNPGNASFGFYSFWPDNQFFGERYVYTQDVLNTFPDAIPHQVRAYPLPGENNAYVLATEEFSQGYDYNDIVAIVRNVKPSEEGETCNQVEPIIASRVLTKNFGNLELQNPSGAPFADRLVFSRISNISGDFGDRIEPFTDLKCHNLNVLRLKNEGSGTLNVDLSISGDAFTLPGGESSLSIGAGETEELIVQFTEDEGSRGIREATLQLQTPSETVNVELAGIYQQAPEGGREEYLGGVAEAFGYSTDMGTNSRGEIESAEPPEDPNFAGPAGDEVISQFWQRADTSEPVYIRQLAAFHSCCSSTSNDSLEVRVNGQTIEEFVHAEVYGQSVLPPLQGSETEAAEMFVEPSGPFELVVRNGYSTDWIGGKNNNDNLGVRFWPVERNGSREGFENTYIVAQDFVDGGCGTTETANCDFNDNMYLITNVEPTEPVQTQ